MRPCESAQHRRPFDISRERGLSCFTQRSAYNVHGGIFEAVAFLGRLSPCLHTLETDPGANRNRIDGTPPHNHLPHWLIPLHAPNNPFSDTYLLLPTPNHLPIYVSIQVSHPFCQNAHAPKCLTMSSVFEMTLFQGQTAFPLTRSPCPCALFVSFPAKWIPEKISQSHFQHNSQIVSRTSHPYDSW